MGYTTSYNSSPLVAASAISIGLAVCNPGSGYVVATTANRASNTVSLAGIAAENSAAGFSFQIITSGKVDLRIVGVLAGTGNYVNVTASGGLVRSSAQTADTIGTYSSDGSVDVNLSLQYGVNATGIQGTAVGTTSAGISVALVGNGTQLRTRKEIYNFLDFRDDTVPFDGSTAEMNANLAAWNKMVTTIPAGSEVYFPRRTYSFNARLFAANGINYQGALGNLHLRAESGRSLGEGQGCRFLWYMSDYTGTSGTFSSYGNGGSGQKMMVMTGCSGITAGMTDVLGQPIRIWNAATKDNNIYGVVTAFGNGTITFRNDNTNASATDANNGKIHWRVERACMDLRLRDTILDGFEFQNIGDVGCILQITESPSPANNPGQGATTISNNKLRNCTFHSDDATQRVRYFLRLATDIVPDSNSGNYSLNGAGVPQFYSPQQVDVTYHDDCSYIGTFAAKCSGVGMYSRTGQGKNHIFRGGQFQGLRNGWTVPTATDNASGQTYQGQGEFYGMGVGFCFDTVYDLCGGSFSTVISACRGETGSSRFAYDRGGNGASSVVIENCFATYYAYDQSGNVGHPCWNILETNRMGPIIVRNNFFQLGGNSSKYRLLGCDNSLAGGALNNSITAIVEGNLIQGTTSVTGRRGHIDASVRGPYVFAGTEVMTLPVQVAGVTTTYTINFTQANFNAACGYTVNLGEVRAFEVALLLEKQVGYTVLRAWGNEDDTILRVFQVSEVTGGTNTIGPASGTAATIMGFTGTGSPSAAIQQAIDTLNLVDGSTDSNSVQLELTFQGNKITDWGGANYASPIVPSFRKVYGPSAKGYNRLESVAGLAGVGGRSGVTPKNFNGSQAFANADTRKTVTFTLDGNANPEADANYMVSSLVVTKTAGSTGPAAGAYTAHVENQTVNGFDIVLAASPGSGGDATATVSVAWMVTR